MLLPQKNSEKEEGLPHILITGISISLATIAVLPFDPKISTEKVIDENWKKTSGKNSNFVTPLLFRWGRETKRSITKPRKVYSSFHFSLFSSNSQS